MAWSTPLTAVSNATLTAAQWNASVRDNLAETAPAKATAAGNFFVSTGANTIAQRIPVSDTINTSQTTTSTSFVDLSSLPSVTTTSDTRIIVWFAAQMNNTVVGAESITSVAVSGTTTTAADDDVSCDVQQPSSGTAFIDITSSRVVRLTVTPGSNTYRLRYRVSAGTGAFKRRTIVALPF